MLDGKALGTHGRLVFRWLIAPIAIVGAFVAAGGGGALIADAVGVLDPDAVGGASAALAVVVVAYLVAPSRPLYCAIGVFVIGACCAWILLHPDPEDSAQPRTCVPLASTWAGAVLALGIISTVHVIRAPRARGA